MMAGSFGIPGLGMLFFWGLIILLAVVLIKGVSRNSEPRPNRSARELLDERFARGEIDQREYQEKKKILT
jgi:putative membrane protein